MKGDKESKTESKGDHKKYRKVCFMTVRVEIGRCIPRTETLQNIKNVSMNSRMN